MPKNTSVSFSQIIEELLDSSKPFSPVYLHRFSDLNPVDLAALKAVWEKIDANRRSALLEDLEEINDADTTVCFDDLSLMTITDPDPRVRSTSIQLLWETNNTSIWRKLMGILHNDPEDTVRASAASGLGIYIYLGEIEEFPEEQYKTIEKTLLDTLKGKENVRVRQKCLESLGFSNSREINSLISKAFASNEIDWKVSALIAMGRTADEGMWGDSITQSLSDQEPEIRFEAVRTAGELGLMNTRQILLEMLANPDNREDKDMMQAIIWSLSQIGGDHVREALTALQDQAEDDEEEEFIGEALENLGLTEDLNILGMMDIDIAKDMDTFDSTDEDIDSELDDLDFTEDDNELSD